MKHEKILTKDLLELHDARVGANVLDGLLLLGLVVDILEDIVEGEGLLRQRRGRHDGRILWQNEKAATRKNRIGGRIDA